MIYSLSGTWLLGHLSPEADLTETLSPDFVPEGWIPAKVPENVHAALRRAGILRGHTYSKDPVEERWVEECDWIYYKAFFYDPEKLSRSGILQGTAELVLEGADTFAEVYLNGRRLGSTRNMFRQYRFPADEALLPGKRNVLVIRFRSAVKEAERILAKGESGDIYSITGSDRIVARKMQMNYGWDFCGRQVSTGLWKAVYLERREYPRIASWYARTASLSRESAKILVEAVIEAGPEDPEGGAAAGCTAELSEPGTGRVFAVKLWPAAQDPETAGETAEEASAAADSPAGVRPGKLTGVIEVPEPRLWWPNGEGEAFLYDLVLTLTAKCNADSEESSTPEDRKAAGRQERSDHTVRARFGIRTVEVAEELQEDQGTSFRFAVNGRKLFIRGANWVPMQADPTDIRTMQYPYYLDMAVRGKIQMLRVWGGGIYEPEEFFRLCDEKGILVWQDFMFACGIYPRDREFLENVCAEAEQAVYAYRNHACLAIWSGDNEVAQAHQWAGRDYEFDREIIGNELLRGVCASLDPGRYYLASSPTSPHPERKGGDNPSSPYQGDQHIYIMQADPGIRANRDYGRQYYKRILGIRPRFVSEFGFIGFPERESFYRFNYRREPIRGGEELKSHIPMAARHLSEGDTDGAIYYSQLFNAMALKYWIEYFRSLKGTCGGTLYWKFNDPAADNPEDYLFPSHMCAVDMYGNPRMTYYVTRRAYADVLAAFVEDRDGDRIHVMAVNELRAPLIGELTVRLTDFRGQVLYEETKDGAALGTDAAAELMTLSRSSLLKYGPPEEMVLKADLRIGGGIISCVNRYYFVDLNDNDTLRLPEAGLEVLRCVRIGHLVRMTLHSARFARTVRVNIINSREKYSDNYFDMDAGETRTIAVTLQEEWKEEEILSAAFSVEAENQELFVVPVPADLNAGGPEH